MKILSIVSSGYEQGGAETTVVSYNDLFAKWGHEVKTLSSDIDPDVPHFSDYEFKSIPSRGIRSVLYALFNPSAYVVTKRVLKEFQPDIVLLHTMQQASSSVLFTLKKYPAIQCVHGPEAFTTSLLAWHMQKSNFKNASYALHDLTFVGKIRYFLLRCIYVPMYKLAFRNVDRFLVFSNFTSNLLKRDGFTMRPISRIPIGIKLPYAPVVVKREPNTIVYVGRLEKFKGVMDLINAMPAVLKSVPSARLELAGEGSYLGELEMHVSALGISKAVTFSGRVSQKKVAGLFAKAIVAVMPSTWPETFGKVGIEAMGLGTPVIATDVGGVRDWLHDGHDGLLVKPGDPHELANAIVRILTNHKLQKNMSTNARTGVAGLTNKKFAQNLLNVIEETVC